MKTLLFLVVIASSFSAHAIISGQFEDGICVGLNNSGEEDLVPLCLTVSTTTSLPTLILEGVEINLNSPETQERLQAELNGDVEPVLLDQLAIQKNITIDELKAQLTK